LNARSRMLCLFVTGALSACAQVSTGNGDPGSGGVPGFGTGGRFGSGSGGLFGGSGGAGGLITGGVGGEMDCGLQTFDLVRKPADVMLVLDRSASMQDDSADVTPTGPTDPSKWSQVVPAMTGVVSATGGGSDISWGLKTFPEDGGGACSNSPPTVTTKIDVPLKAMNVVAMNAAINTTLPNGDGTPTSAAVRVATSYLQGLPDTNRKYILLATDGDPSCGGVAGALTSNTNAVPDAVSALSAALSAGVPTFVVGVGSKASSLMTLNMLAVAGGKPVQDPNPLAMRFYQAANQAQLSDALTAITSQVNNCTFPLSKAPPVPENIAVKVTGVKAPQDTGNTQGWNYTDASHTAVQVFGTWCDMIKTSAANMVEIIFGCPNIDIP
jgi:von Willebrand factor type A domain